MAHMLHRAGKDFFVFDSPGANTSSSIAAGIMNPITGKRMTLTWRAREFFPYAGEFYAETEQEFDVKCFYPLPVYRVFSSAGELNDWSAKLTDDRYERFLQGNSVGKLKEGYGNPDGALRVDGGGRLSVTRFMEATTSWLQEQGRWEQKEVAKSDVIVTNNGYEIGGVLAQKLIFCTGLDNTFWTFLPFTPMKGEVLELEASGLDRDKIVVGGCFVSPNEQGNYFAGATYDWRNIDLNTTEKGREEVLQKVNKFIETPYRVVGHSAGIRPAVKDRRPLLGEHPTHKNMYLFGGLGSKGVSMAPLLANELLHFMETGEELDREIDLKRFL